MKHEIEKNTVQETLVIPLYSRKLCTELYPNPKRQGHRLRCSCLSLKVLRYSPLVARMTMRERKICRTH